MRKYFIWVLNIRVRDINVELLRYLLKRKITVILIGTKPCLHGVGKRQNISAFPLQPNTSAEIIHM